MAPRAMYCGISCQRPSEMYLSQFEGSASARREQYPLSMLIHQRVTPPVSPASARGPFFLPFKRLRDMRVLAGQCPLLALSGRHAGRLERPLSGVKRTCRLRCKIPANYARRTSAVTRRTDFSDENPNDFARRNGRAPWEQHHSSAASTCIVPARGSKVAERKPQLPKVCRRHAWDRMPAFRSSLCRSSRSKKALTGSSAEPR